MVEATSGTRSVTAPSPLTSGRSPARAASERAGGRPDAIDSRSRRISVAFSGRSSRSRSVAESTNPSSSFGTFATAEDGFGTRPDRCLYAMLIAVSPVNGSRPVSSSYVTMPSEYRSERGSAGSPRICSGDRYCTVPCTPPACVALPSA